MKNFLIYIFLLLPLIGLCQKKGKIRRAIEVSRQQANQGGPPILESRDHNVFGGSTNSCTVNKPSGVIIGEFLGILVSIEQDGDGTEVNSLSGWTKEFEFGDTSTDTRLALFWRIADGTEGASETITTVANVRGAVWYLRFSNASGIHVVGANREITTGTSGIADSLTTTDDHTYVIAMLAFDGGDGHPFTVSGTGWPSSFDTNQSLTDGTGAGAWSGAWVGRVLESAGASNDVTFVSTVDDDMETVQFAIK